MTRLDYRVQPSKVNTEEEVEMPEGVTLYDYDDFAAQNRNMFETAKKTLAESFPMQHGSVRVELHDLDYEDPEEATIKQQKQALLQNQYLARRLRGKVRLVDVNTNQTIEEKHLTLMRVPYTTQRGTYIHGGNEYTMIRQMRLLPGAYSRQQENGELENHWNVRAKTGTPFRIAFEPDKAQYRMRVSGSNLHLYSLLKDIGVKDDTLASMWGEELLNLNAKKYDARVLDKAYAKLVKKSEIKPNATREDKAKAIREALDRSMVHEGAVRRTLPNMFDLEKSAEWQKAASFKDDLAKQLAKLAVMDKTLDITGQAGTVSGVPDEGLLQTINAKAHSDLNSGSAMYPPQKAAPAVQLVKPLPTAPKLETAPDAEGAGIGKEAAQAPARITEAKMEEDGETYIPVGVRGLLASTEKLLAINKGVAQPDDRDHYVFKRLHTPADFLRDRIRLDDSKLRRRMMYNLNRTKSLKGLSPFAFDSYAEGLITNNPLSMPLEEINPLHLAEQARRTTQMGPGGIGSESQITDAARAVNLSQIGFMSGLEVPENAKAGVDSRLSWGAKYGSDGKLYQKVYDRRRKRMRWVSPEDLYGAVIALPR